MTHFFGFKGKDKITGFTGIITGHCTYISGCSQFLLSPPAKEGDYKTATWFDEQRVEVLYGAPIVLDNSITPGCDIEAPTK